MEELDDITTDELVDPKAALKEKRGKTLPVIAILTMVNVGWMAIQAVMSLAQGPQPQSAIDEIKAQMLESIDPEAQDMGTQIVLATIAVIEQSNENTYAIAGMSLLCAAIGFLGAFLMYRLKRNGFYLYIIYCFLAVAYPFAFLPNNMITVWTAIIGVVFSVLFIILYANQLKRME